MANYTIKIPDIGEGITEVEVVEWFVKVGESVTEDQKVASVMTEKVAVEITSPVQGKVEGLGGQAGDILAVGADLIHIALAAKGNSPEPEPEPTAAPISSKPTPTPAPVPVAAGSTTPHQRLLHKVQASPAVRKRAADLALDLDSLAQQLGKKHLNHTDLDQALSSASAGLAPKAKEKIEHVAIRGLRRQIAKKMLESSQTIPHFSYIEAVDVTEVEQWRKQLNTQWAESRGHLTLLPFIMRAICVAVAEHPEVNARYDADNESLDRYEAVHVAVATQTAEGLRVPVVESAQNRSLWDIAKQVRELAQQAHEGSGNLGVKSTITLSSLGPLGGLAATPIINAPEVSIIGVNRQREQPVVIDGQIQIRTMMNLSSSFDHRFVDGWHAAQFIQAIRRILETPQLYLI